MNLSYTLKGHKAWVNEVEWYPGEGSKLVSGSSGHDWQMPGVRFWDLNHEDSSVEVRIDLDGVTTGATATAVEALTLQPGMSDAFSESQHQTSFLASRRETEANEGASKTSILGGFTFPGSFPGFGSSLFSPDGSLIFYLPTRMTVTVFSVSTPSEMFRLEGHTDAIMWVGASPDGKLLATSSWDRTVKIWNLRDGSLVRTLKGTEGQNWTGSWSPDGKLIAVGSGDRTVRVWDVFSGKTVHALGEGEDMFSGWVRGLAFERSNGSYLVAAAEGGTVRVFEKHSGECTNLYQIDLIASSPLGRIAESFMEISDSLKHAPSPSSRFGFKPTGGRLVVYDTARNEMWEFVQDKEGSARLFGGGMFVFAKGGKRVYSGDVDGALRVWDID